MLTHLLDKVKVQTFVRQCDIVQPGRLVAETIVTLLNCLTSNYFATQNISLKLIPIYQTQRRTATNAFLLIANMQHTLTSYDKFLICRKTTVITAC